MSTTIEALAKELKHLDSRIALYSGQYFWESFHDPKNAGRYNSPPRLPTNKMGFAIDSVAECNHGIKNFDKEIAVYKGYLIDNLKAVTELPEGDDYLRAKQFLVHRTNELENTIRQLEHEKRMLEIERDSIQWKLDDVTSKRTSILLALEILLPNEDKSDYTIINGQLSYGPSEIIKAVNKHTKAVRARKV